MGVNFFQKKKKSNEKTRIEKEKEIFKSWRDLVSQFVTESLPDMACKSIFSAEMSALIEDEDYLEDVTLTAEALEAYWQNSAHAENIFSILKELFSSNNISVPFCKHLLL